MKIVLTQDVPTLGKAGEVKEVANGYARNYLVPQGKATLATKGLIKQAQERADAQRRRDVKARGDNEALAQRINGQTVRFVVKVGEMERMYGSITNVDIADKLAQALKIDVDRRRVELGDPIKRAGVYSVVVNLGHGLEPRINVVVEGEGGEAADTVTSGSRTYTAPADEAASTTEAG